MPCIRDRYWYWVQYYPASGVQITQGFQDLQDAVDCATMFHMAHVSNLNRKSSSDYPSVNITPVSNDDAGQDDDVWINGSYTPNGTRYLQGKD